MKPYPRNPRLISKKRLDRLADTLTRLGDLSGIVHNLATDEIIGGHQRMKVFGEGRAEIVECREIPDAQGTVAHGYIVWGGSKYAYRQVRWDEATAAEANIAANMGAGDWDWNVIANAWDAPQLQEWGMDADTLKAWNTDATNLKEMLKAEAGGDGDAEPQIDRAAELLEKWGVVAGDLWRIGGHRLLCGDSTDREQVERVMQGEKAGMMVTDVPYGVEYRPAWRDEADKKGVLGNRYAIRSKGEVQNDDISDWTPAYKLFCGDVAYIWSGDKHIDTVLNNLSACGFVIVNINIWAKPHFALSQGDYHSQHENCVYAVRKGKNHLWAGDRTQSTLWEIAGMNPMGKSGDQQDERTGHGTQKPIECMARPVRNHTAEIIYDPFAGSGTTLVACQNLARRCRAIEISPNYVAVCLERMATAFPGIEIERL